MSDQEGIYNCDRFRDYKLQTEEFLRRAKNIQGMLDIEELFLTMLVSVGPLYYFDMQGPVEPQESNVGCWLDRHFIGDWPLSLVVAYTQWCLDLREQSRRTK